MYLLAAQQHICSCLNRYSPSSETQVGRRFQTVPWRRETPKDNPESCASHIGIPSKKGVLLAGTVLDSLCVRCVNHLPGV